MAEMAELQGPSVQPWHTFTAMFVTFWAVSAYFDHFLMTIVFCVAFGVLAEIYSKVMMEGDGTHRPAKIEFDDVADEEKKMLRKLEEEKIKQELEILEIMKAEEELERQKKLLIEKVQMERDQKNKPEEIESHNQVIEIKEEVIVANTVDTDSVVRAVQDEENEIPPPLPSKDFFNDAVCDSLPSRSEDKTRIAFDRVKPKI